MTTPQPQPSAETRARELLAQIKLCSFEKHKIDLLTTLITKADERDLIIAHLQAGIESDSVVASCNCLTKSPDIQYHKIGCKYRLITERDSFREKAEALDWLETTSINFEIVIVDGVPTFSVGFRPSYLGKGPSLLSAITAARKNTSPN